MLRQDKQMEQRTCARVSRIVAGFTFTALLCLFSLNVVATETKTVDRIVVEKSARTMKLMRGDEVLKTYKVALGHQPIGAKQRVGDHKTPEGNYVIDFKNRESRFHLALHVSYPNAADRERAHKLGADPGGNIEIHGLESKFAWLGSLHRGMDWTDGCIAVSNAEIEEIWPLVPVGTPLQILP
jgi:murein L,D-transpeptidase YafK